LWSSAKEWLRWRLSAEGEEKLNELAQETLQEKYGDLPNRDWQTLTLPSITGFLQVGWAQ
jgi:hypothetical protein